jgi:GDPmannose 4,6-dehydratase
MKLRWEGKGVKEVGIVESVVSPQPSAVSARSTALNTGALPTANCQLPTEWTQHSALSPGRVIVAVDPRYFRPTEVDALLGDASKARKKLGWTPKIKFKQLVAEMVSADFKAAERDELVKRHGHKVFDRNE